jgi:hypothetical protein
MCSSNVDEIANIKKVDRAMTNKYKAQVRQLGGLASDDEDIASLSTACTKPVFRMKGYEEYFYNDSVDEEGRQVNKPPNDSLDK